MDFLGAIWRPVALCAGLCLGVSAWLLPGVARADRPAPPAIRETLDLRYFPVGARHTLDVFAPAAAAAAPAPVVLFVHGGTWMMGDKNFGGQYRSVGRYLAEQGIVAVLINYRLSPAVKHPEHVKDVARAFAWVRRNIRRFGGDPDRIVLAGHSAGGHLVSLLATDPRYLADPALKLTAADRHALRGVISASGVYRVPGPEEFGRMMGEIAEIYVGDSKDRVSRLMRAGLVALGQRVSPFRLVFGSSPDVQKQASPLSHVRRGLPPFLLLYAGGEVPGLTQMAEDFAKALRGAGNSVEVRTAPAKTHQSILLDLDSPGDPIGPALVAFVRLHAGPPVQSARAGP
jgi:acetyl esterase/lipase